MNPTLVGIAGGTGSGKTTLCARLQQELGEDLICLIHFDGYFVPDPLLTISRKRLIDRGFYQI